MENKPIKEELYQLIDKCDNELILEEAKDLLETGKAAKDWWDELTEEDKHLIKESEVQYGKGNYISHQELMQRFEAWKKK
jgi:hypothetical protein